MGIIKLSNTIPTEKKIERRKQDQTTPGGYVIVKNNTQNAAQSKIQCDSISAVEQLGAKFVLMIGAVPCEQSLLRSLSRKIEGDSARRVSVRWFINNVLILALWARI